MIVAPVIVSFDGPFTTTVATATPPRAILTVDDLAGEAPTDLLMAACLVGFQDINAAVPEQPCCEWY